MRKYRLTDVVQEDFGCGPGALNRAQNGHAQMFERRVHLTMRPTECIDDGSAVFICKLIECCAWYIELHDVNRIGKERNWLLFEIEDRHSSRRSFPGGNQFSGEPQPASAVRAKMQVY